MKSFCFAMATLFSTYLFSQDSENRSYIENPKRNYTTALIENINPPKIDGKLNDGSWNIVNWESDFKEWLPDENTNPTKKTQFKIIYDRKNIYVAIKCFDDPEKIGKWLSRRDGFEGDWVQVHFDSYGDARSSFSFTVSAAGVKGDEFISNDGEVWDASWNPIWFVKTAIVEDGWTAEMKIPLSQLRFGKDKEQVWGLQVVRDFLREDSFWVWQRKPINNPGWVSEFGELHGLKNLDSQKQIEIQPFTVGAYETFPAQLGNPFRDGRDDDIDFGLDAKIGITNDLTLDLTINPDFGQVEADPSRIALDGFQIFFREQRPFFVENNNIFDYRFSRSRTGGSFGFDNLFYSRRIGRRPQGYPEVNSGEFVDIPKNTTILGAAKFSGKTRNGWSIGILESVTGKEYALIDDGISNDVVEREELVEPLTNYFVGRVQKDFNKNNSWVGGIFTSTNRSLNDKTDFLHKSAYTAGLDFKHQWKNRVWYLGGSLVYSHVNGSTEAIERTQRTLTHLFQRVDASYLDVDTSRTSLTGSGGNIQIGKQGGGKWRFESGVTWRSPELEINDLGFQRRSDDIRHYTRVTYRLLKPTKKFRSFRIDYRHFLGSDFGGNIYQLQYRLNSVANFTNNWVGSLGASYSPIVYSNFALRGGPRLRFSPEFSYNANIRSDNTKSFYFNIGGDVARPTDNSWEYQGANLGVTFRPINALQLSLETSISKNIDNMQFVNNVEYDDVFRSITARINQDTFSMSLRLNYNVNPNLTIQYWGQPFISRGRYTDFKYVTNSTAKQFADRFIEYNTNQISYLQEEDLYQIDEDLDNNLDFTLSNPDFNIVQFRSNLVLRWEYIPGSEIFLVWSQDISKNQEFSSGLISNLSDGISNTQPNNIFLLKATYRFRL